MKNKFTVATVAIVQNDQGEFLVTKRSDKEDHAPGIYSYPGGKLEYTGEEYNILEQNLKKEIFEETNVNIGNITYLSSHSFEKDNGDKVCVVAFLADYESGKLEVKDQDEISEVHWMSLDEIEKLDTLPIIKKIYHSAQLEIEESSLLHHISVAGIVINDKQELLLLREIDPKTQNKSKYTFPKGEVKQLPGTTWEMLEKNLGRVVYSQTNIEIADGAIPFTDESFVGVDGFDSVVQFYICKYKFGKESIGMPQKFAEVSWVKFSDLKQDDFEPLIYQVITKAIKFIQTLNSN